MAHANAALTPRARLTLARLIVDDGWPIARAARAVPGVLADRETLGRPLPRARRGRAWPTGPAARTTARAPPRRRWCARSCTCAGNSASGRSRSPTGSGCAPSTVAPGAGAAAGSTGSPTSTGPPASRCAATNTPTPGDLLHVDVKKLGNIPDGGGWRFVGRAQGDRNRAATPGKPRNRHRNPKMGTAYVHTVLDDHSRVAYAEIHDDETAATAIAVLRRAVAWFAARGVTVARVLSDNGIGLPLHLWRDTCTELGDHPETDPPLPPPNQRQDRTLPPHPDRRVGLSTPLHQRVPTPQSPTRLAPRVQPPPTPHRHRRPTTHHPLNQPVRAVQLGRAHVPVAGVPSASP